MARRYETARAPRFSIEHGAEGEQIRVPARRNVFALMFLPFWLFFWTIGGIAAIVEFARNGQPFLAIWLCGWAVGWMFAAGTVAWMVWGAELLRVSGGDLETGESLFGWARMRRYRGSEIRDLSANSTPFFAQFQFPLPFLMRPRSGSVKFHHGARTLYAAQGLDEAEGQMIVAHLLRQLPRSAGE